MSFNIEGVQKYFGKGKPEMWYRLSLAAAQREARMHSHIMPPQMYKQIVPDAAKIHSQSWWRGFYLAATMKYYDEDYYEHYVHRLFGDANLNEASKQYLSTLARENLKDYTSLTIRRDLLEESKFWIVHDNIDLAYSQAIMANAPDPVDFYKQQKKMIFSPRDYRDILDTVDNEESFFRAQAILYDMNLMEEKMIDMKDQIIDNLSKVTGRLYEQDFSMFVQLQYKK